MKVILLIIFYSINLSLVSADEVKCSGYTTPSTPSSLEKLVNDCAIQKELASDPLVQEKHRKNVYDKLADKLAIQIKQNSENISMLTSYYNSNGQDLMMNSKAIAQSCRLDSIKAIEKCGGKSSGPLQNHKLELLKSKLPKNDNTPFENDQSLFGIMAGKFYTDLGMKGNRNALQCPVEGESGNFMLTSQIDEISAVEIFNNINLNGANNQLFDKYPQLKIIQNTKDPVFIEKFLNYIKNKPAGSNAKDYIANFFFETKNQQTLAPTLAAQCDRITQNLNEFLCSDITELGSLDDNTSRNLFNKLNTTESMADQYDVNFKDESVLTAYGLQCIAKEKMLTQPSGSHNNSSIDKWYADFTGNIRGEDSEQNSKKRVGDFCSMYTCQTENSKKLNSCKGGGPLASVELRKLLGCDLVPIGESCKTQDLKNIAYMESLEKLKKDSKDQVASSSTPSSSNSNSSSTSKEEKIVIGRLPNFAENYFGVEGSLKALGKKATPYEIAEKKQDFVEKKLVTTDPVYTAPGTPAVKAPKVAETTTNDNPATRPSYTPTQMSQNSNRTQAVSSTTPVYAPTIKSPTSAKMKNQKPVESDSSGESSRLRDEMEKMIADIKNTKADIETSKQKIDYPDGFTELGGMGSSNASTPANRAEQERLKRLEQSLYDKANRLEEYRRELDNRNFAQNGYAPESGASRSAASGAPNSGSSAGGSGGGSNSSSGNSGSGNSLKLSSAASAKADGKASGNNYTAALIQSGVESSTMTVDELSNLSPDSLKKLGIDSSLPFTLKVTFDGQTYQVPVKSFIYKGAKILGPVMDPKNKELNDFLLKSPLFKQYYNYRFEKENQPKN